MAQRGGSVVAHLRIADHPVYSSIIARGSAELIISMEPLESLRYLDYLSADGTLITAGDPVRNIKRYPELAPIHEHIRELPHARLVEAATLARQAGSLRATNMVMVGAASHLLPIPPETIESYISEAFAGKGEKIVEINLRAFRAGREASACVTA